MLYRLVNINQKVQITEAKLDNFTITVISFVYFRYNFRIFLLNIIIKALLVYLLPNHIAIVSF